MVLSSFCVSAHTILYTWIAFHFSCCCLIHSARLPKHHSPLFHHSYCGQTPITLFLLFCKIDPILSNINSKCNQQRWGKGVLLIALIVPKNFQIWVHWKTSVDSVPIHNLKHSRGICIIDTSPSGHNGQSSLHCDPRVFNFVITDTFVRLCDCSCFKTKTRKTGLI